MVMGGPELNEILVVSALVFQWELNFYSKYREANLEQAGDGVTGSALLVAPIACWVEIQC